MAYIHVGGFYFNVSSGGPNQAPPPSDWLSKSMNWSWSSLTGTIEGKRQHAGKKLKDRAISRLTEKRELFSFVPEAITYVQSALLLSAMAIDCKPM